MSTGKLEVWIAGRLDQTEHFRVCQVSELPWRVFVFDCCGGPLTWCGRTYTCLPTTCGRLDLEVPPGCYFLRAAVFSGHNCTGHITELTGIGIATVGCGQEVCVTLVSFRAQFAFATEEEKRWLVEEAEQLKPGPVQPPPTP